MITKELVKNAMKCGHLQIIETHYDRRNNVQMLGYRIGDVGVGVGVKSLWDDDDEPDYKFVDEEDEEDEEDVKIEGIPLWEVMVKQDDETVRILTEAMNKIPVSGKIENYLKKSMGISAFVSAVKAEKDYSQMSKKEYDMCVSYESVAENYALRQRLAKCLNNYFYNLVNKTDYPPTDELMCTALTWADNVFGMEDGYGKTEFLFGADGKQILTEYSIEWYRKDFAKTVCQFLEKESERIKKPCGISEGAVKKIEKNIWAYMESVFSM